MLLLLRFYRVIGLSSDRVKTRLRPVKKERLKRLKEEVSERVEREKKTGLLDRVEKTDRKGSKYEMEGWIYVHTVYSIYRKDGRWRKKGKYVG